MIKHKIGQIDSKALAGAFGCRPKITDSRGNGILSPSVNGKDTALYGHPSAMYASSLYRPK